MELEKVKPVNVKQSFSFTSHIELYENCSLQYKFFKELGFAQIRVGQPYLAHLYMKLSRTFIGRQCVMRNA